MDTNNMPLCLECLDCDIFYVSPPPPHTHTHTYIDNAPYVFLCQVVHDSMYNFVYTYSCGEYQQHFIIQKYHQLVHVIFTSRIVLCGGSDCETNKLWLSGVFSTFVMCTALWTNVEGFFSGGGILYTHLSGRCSSNRI